MTSIPSSLTEEGRVAFHTELMFNDPNHRWFTGECVGRLPTSSDLILNWFNSGAYEATNKLFNEAVTEHRQGLQAT